MLKFQFSGLWILPEIENVKADLFDKFFGGGTAKARVVFKTRDNSSYLSLKVWKKVRSGEITFALSVFRTEIRGYDAAGELVYFHNFDGFAFGDSSSGHWSHKLQELPANIQQIQATFIRNCEYNFSSVCINFAFIPLCQ
ncbi:MAG: hypothetical protein UZ01_03578 [Candidatus Brocadia sinica]|nr:MAG: hypothetical protein UZ01_03578 [Candidatus Brocadia sinica]